jgi:aminodeoxyfutalosine deaminase
MNHDQPHHETGSSLYRLEPYIQKMTQTIEIDPSSAAAAFPPNMGKAKDRIRLNASAIADASFGVIENGSLLLERTEDGVEVLAAGAQGQVSQQLSSDKLPVPIYELTLNNQVLMPALVNAHTHLDLSHIGPVEHDPNDGFVKWVDMIRKNRKQEDEQIRSSVTHGIQLALDGGTVAVGDIAGAPAGRLTDAPAYQLAESPLSGVSFLEFFGIGKTSQQAIIKVQSYLRDRFPTARESFVGSRVCIGFQPHAPNTVDLGVYRWVIRDASMRGIPVSTHLAETPEEREFIESGTGSQRELLERLGVWDESVLDLIAKGSHPVEHILQLFDQETKLEDQHAPLLVAHVNDAPDEMIHLLSRTNTSVAYCPRASSYFASHTHFGAHRYQSMLDAGVNVCLGTDSIVNLDTHDRISVLDEMRLLARRDGTDPKTLMSMATVNGGKALGFDPKDYSLSLGASPLGLISIPLGEKTNSRGADPWSRIMQNNEAPEWVFLREKKGVSSSLCVE